MSEKLIQQALMPQVKKVFSALINMSNLFTVAYFSSKTVLPQIYLKLYKLIYWYLDTWVVASLKITVYNVLVFNSLCFAESCESMSAWNQPVCMIVVVDVSKLSVYPH